MLIWMITLVDGHDGLQFFRKPSIKNKQKQTKAHNTTYHFIYINVYSPFLLPG
jgi:hypothetical protein